MSEPPPKVINLSEQRAARRRNSRDQGRDGEPLERDEKRLPVGGEVIPLRPKHDAKRKRLRVRISAEDWP